MSARPNIHKTLEPFVAAIGPRGWTIVSEYYDDSDHAYYWIHDESGMPVCRAMSREYAEMIVKDHNA